MLSNTSKYALRAVLYLAVNATKNKKLGIKKISEDLEIPTPFLGKILQSLAKHNLLTSIKGPNGGFGLAKEASKIRLIEIIEIIEGKDVFNTCFVSNKSCDHVDNVCPMHEKYFTIKTQYNDFFKNTTVSALTKDFKTNKPDNIIL